MRRFASIFVSLTLLSFVVVLPAHAAGAYDIALDLDISPTPSSIQNGTSVNLNITLTNEGENPLGPRSVHHVFLPPSLELTGVSTSISGLNCAGAAPVSDYAEFNFDPKYESYTYVNCVGSGDFLDVLLPGSSAVFTIQTTANASLTNGTSVVVINAGNPDEVDYVDVASGLIDAVSNGGDPAEINSNNVASYTYSASATTTTTASGTSGSSSDSSTSSNSVTNSGTSAGSGTTVASGAADGSSLVEDSTSQDADEKAEVALDIRNSLPDRIGREDPGTWEALLAGTYKNQFIGVILILAMAAGAFYILRKRYIKKLTVEREYRRALKAKSIKNFPLQSSESPKSDVGA
jgi:hypothetical protein